MAEIIRQTEFSRTELLRTFTTPEGEPRREVRSLYSIAPLWAQDPDGSWVESRTLVGAGLDGDFIVSSFGGKRGNATLTIEPLIEIAGVLLSVSDLPVGVGLTFSREQRATGYKWTLTYSGLGSLAVGKVVLRVTPSASIQREGRLANVNDLLGVDFSDVFRSFDVSVNGHDIELTNAADLIDAGSLVIDPSTTYLPNGTGNQVFEWSAQAFDSNSISQTGESEMTLAADKDDISDRDFGTTETTGDSPAGIRTAYDIDEAAANVTDVRSEIWITNGAGTVANRMQLWDANAGSWTELASSATTGDQSFNETVSTNASNHVTGTGKVHNAFEGTSSINGVLDVAHMEVEVTATEPAPTLTNASCTVTGSSTLDWSVDTDTGDGTLYFVATTSSTKPSVAQIKAGQDHTGTAAADSGSQAVSATGTQNGSASGLDPETQYFVHFVHEDASANDSDVVSTTGCTTKVIAFRRRFGSRRFYPGMRRERGRLDDI